MNFQKMTSLLIAVILFGNAYGQLPYTIIDTAQIRCYDNDKEIEYPRMGGLFFGQDAHYSGNQPAYKDNGDGTVTDLNTDLMWTQNPGSKKTHAQAAAGASKCRIGGYTDWRLSTIKELYSLILFSGLDPDPMGTDTSQFEPYIDRKAFRFSYGNPADGDRIIDSQFATCTLYHSTTMGGNKTMFGVNFADGRIKGYPVGSRARMPGRGEKTYYVLYVRGNPNYGRNQFVDNGDGTITDKATGLIWMKTDSGGLKAGSYKNGRMNWQQALAWAENLDYAGHSDWRLPNAKELQSIVDYSRCPDVTDSAAIDPIFKVTSIKNEAGQKDYPYYWTGTTHTGTFRASAGVYIAFGRALGYILDRRTGRSGYMDVHGAGCQRSDVKSGNPSRLPKGRGPQGDVMRIYNYVRCVRGGAATLRQSGPVVKMTQSPQRRPGRGQQMGSQHRQGRQMGPGPGIMQGPGGGGGHFIQRLDRDGDGKVSGQEFDGPSEHFSRFDRNRDGYLSSDEAPQGPPPNRRSGSGRRF